MKVKIRCDKHYNGGKHNIIDGGAIRDWIIFEIIKKFSKDGELIITENVVDYYNSNCSSTSCKSANSLATSCRKIINEIEKASKI